jgi:NCS1 family nucleobase:cation symporter-1
MADCVKFGIQSYYGGQAVVVVLNSIFLQLLRLKNTLLERYVSLIATLLYVADVFSAPGSPPRLFLDSYCLLCSSSRRSSFLPQDEQVPVS